MFWNHRLVDHGEEYEEEDARFEIVEVYYKEDGEPLGYCGFSFLSGTIDGIREEIEMAEKSLDKPIINIKEVFGNVDDKRV